MSDGGLTFRLGVSIPSRAAAYPLGRFPTSTAGGSEEAPMLNPDPGRISGALWYFAVECLAMEPGTRYGGTYADKPGYHNTRDNLLNQGRSGDYSVRLPADRAGPGDKTAAFDWTFSD